MIARADRAQVPAARGRGGRRSIAVGAAGIWLGSRLPLLLLTYVTLVLNSPHTRTGVPGSPDAYSSALVRPSRLLLAWQQFDAGWYLAIAQHGYADRQSAAFFPLYPLLVRLGTLVLTPLHLPLRPAALALLAALGVSALAALVGFLALARLAAEETGSSSVALRTLALLAAFPVAFFLAAPYTEATFLALAVLALLFARRGRWPAASLAAYLCGLTRSTAVILVLPLLYEYGRQRSWWPAAGRRPARGRSRPGLAGIAGGLGVVAGAPLGLVSYMAYLWRRFGDPLAFAGAERFWTRRLTPPQQTAQLVLHQLTHLPAGGYFELITLLNVGLLATFAVLTLALARRLPAAFTLYLAGLVGLAAALPTLGEFDVLHSASRFMLVGFPAFIGLARLLEGRPGWELFAIGGGFLVQAALATFFLTGGWVA